MQAQHHALRRELVHKSSTMHEAATELVRKLSIMHCVARDLKSMAYAEHRALRSTAGAQAKPICKAAELVHRLIIMLCAARDLARKLSIMLCGARELCAS